MNILLYKCLPGLILFSGFRLSSQDTVRLKDVEVTATKHQFSAYGKKIQEFDSAQKQQFVFNSVGELASLNSPVFIKNYGPGSISSTAFRGGSASHTGILWNGFNIQNAMLGQADLSLLPSMLFDKISIEYGGSSALWGSGAVAGSIHLNNEPEFNRGLTTRANIGGGSYGLFSSSAAIEKSNERFIYGTKLYVQNSANTFLFRDTLDKENSLKEQQHAAYSIRGLMQELKFLSGKRHVFSMAAWYNESYREIPVFSKYSQSTPNQKDVNLKAFADWRYLHAKLRNMFRAGSFYDELHFDDAGYEIKSSAFLNTIILENESFYYPNKNFVLNLGINYTSSSAITESYNGKKSLNKLAVSSGMKCELLPQKLLLLGNFRAEYFSAGKLPITGNTAIDYKPAKSLTLKLNAAKVYRHPTLNELYWIPGGNKNLLPEQGYTTEGDLGWQTKKGNYVIKISGSAFYRMIDNWVLWLPSNCMSTPVNIQKVFSRGTETQSGLSYHRNKTSIALNVISSYVLSTVVKNNQEYGNTAEKQLIYTPRYTFNSNITMGYSGFSLTIYHQYVGYRFTSSDNLQWLPPYHLFNARLNFKTKINSTNFIVFAACNNLTANNYAIVAGRPMPLRNFEFGLSLHHNKQKSILTKD